MSIQLIFLGLKWETSRVYKKTNIDRFASKGYRPLGYSFDDYMQDLNVYVNWIQSKLSPLPLLIGPSFGPSFIGNSTWLSLYLSQFASSASSILAISVHRYEVSNCIGVNSVPVYPEQLATFPSPNTLSVADLMISSINFGQTAFFTEFGAASCSGIPEFSQSFAAGLFILDSLFEFSYRRIPFTCISGTPSSESISF